MKNNKWELYNDCCESKYDVAHCVERSKKPTSYVYSVDDGKKVPSVGHYMRTTIFVKSLVSPIVLVIILTRDRRGIIIMRNKRRTSRGRKVMRVLKAVVPRAT